MPISLANRAISSFPESSIATPTTCRPSDPYWFCSSTSQGVSILQGPHQVAQKFSSTALPRSSESFMLPPSSLSRVKSGAGVDLPRTAGALARERCAVWKPKYSMVAAITATTTKERGLRPPLWGGEGGSGGGVRGSGLPPPGISGVDINKRSSQSKAIQE